MPSDVDRRTLVTQQQPIARHSLVASYQELVGLHKRLKPLLDNRVNLGPRGGQTPDPGLRRHRLPGIGKPADRGRVPETDRH